ncbi:hypothetical protein Airi01_019440 [Actinoallomurus iriomotensis]|uniref:Uncharacterized protein n=2 Tax=Actinoallomurus iriomotensis TaxID=478107 RepID=A0A9W6RGK9_9ACTN|nr:hypothetical protein Airi01_019440 [Actinoallomurus iriomotensis]
MEGNGHDDSDVKQELQVRIAAQRLLARHLALPHDGIAAEQNMTAPEKYWASHPNSNHVWPADWQVAPSGPPGMAPLVRRP